MIRTLCTLGAALLWLSACGGSEAAQPGGYSDICNTPTSCDKGFECIVGMCTSRCQTDADCKVNGDRSICASNSYCYEQCSDATECTGIHPELTCNLVASTQGTCRPR